MAVRISRHPTRPSSHRPCGCHSICGTTICRYTQLGALTRWERWSSSVKPSEIPCSANALVWYPPSLFRNVQKVAVPVTNEEVWNLLGLVQEEGVDPAAKTKLPQSNFKESLNRNTIQHTYWGLAGCCSFCSWFWLGWNAARRIKIVKRTHFFHFRYSRGAFFVLKSTHFH